MISHSAPYIMGMCFLISLCGCSTTHQIFKYQTSVKKVNHHLIPGVEPEEAANKIMIVARGKGVAPENGSPMERRFMAERAAVIDGYRQLTERLAGIIVHYYAESGKNTISHDQVMIEASAYLRGAQIFGVSYQDGYATANVKVYIKPRKNKFYGSLPSILR